MQNQVMKTLGPWFTKLAEFIAATMLAAIFITFLAQIFSRYAAEIAWLMPIGPIASWMSAIEPIGWTVNLISLIWVWLIFFGCSFLVNEKEHVAFDIIYQAVSDKARRVLAIIGAMIVIGMMCYSFLPTWDAIMTSRLMELKKIQTLSIPITGDKIPVKWLFASYVLLMFIVTVRYALQIFLIYKNGAPLPQDEGMIANATANEDTEE